MARCCAVGARSFTPSIAKALEELVVPPLQSRSVGRRTVGSAGPSLAQGRGVGKALTYTLEAAERARTLFARPEAINHYWQALDLLERLPHTSERSRVHCDVHCVARSASGLEAE